MCDEHVQKSGGFSAYFTVKVETAGRQTTLVQHNLGHNTKS